MNTTLSPRNAAAVAGYAKILGCNESEFLNRYLELELDDPKDEIMTVWDTIESLVKFTFKSREEAQRVLDWFYAAAKADALERGETIRIRTEIVEMGPCYSDYLEAMDLDAVFMINIATCDVDRENQPIHVIGNPDLYPKKRAPEYHWSDEPYPKGEK